MLKARLPRVPEGFRIEVEDFGGTGHGDEQFRFVLHQWRQVQVGLFRRRTKWAWVRKESSTGDSPHAYRTLVRTALLIAKTDPQI